MSLTEDQLRRYSRQIALPGIGVEGQTSLLESSVLVVGAGGLGSAVLPYLAAGGIGRIAVVDGDTVQFSNLHRQTLYTEEDLGLKKASTAVAKLQKLNSDPLYEAIDENLTVQNSCELIREHDVVIDCSDNFGTRYLINDSCVMENKPFVSASLLRYEGQVATFNVERDGSRTATYRDLYPQPPAGSDAPNCSEAGVLGTFVGIMGSHQANFAIQVLLGSQSKSLNSLLIVNLRDGSQQKITLPEPNFSEISSLLSEDNYRYCNNATREHESKGAMKEISPTELQQRLQNGDDITLIDVREPFEKEVADIGGTLIPLGTIGSRADEIPRDKDVVLYCRGGRRSGDALLELERDHGFTNLINLQGGILEWSEKVDSSIPKY